MEHISNSLVKAIQEPPELTGYLANLKTTFEPEEIRILGVKYNGLRFGCMTWKDLDIWAKALLVKINSITGWVIPDDTLEILVDQFRKKLVESYGDCTSEEIEYAFRNYGTVVKDWGKQMNLSLIDEVMIPYLGRRLEVSEHEEALAMRKVPQIEFKEDMSQEAMQSWFDEKAKEIKAGKLKVDFVPLMLYEWMDANGNISATKEEKYKYLQRAADYRQGQLEEELQAKDDHPNRWRLSNFMSQKNRGYFEGDEADRIKSLAKKILLFEMILNSEK